MGFFDDFASGFSDSFNDSYASASRIREQTEAETAKAKAKAFLDAQEREATLRAEDRARIQNAQNQEKEWGLPEGTWVNLYNWDKYGFSADKIYDLATTGTFNAIPVPEGDTTNQTSTAPSSEASTIAPVDAQTNAALGDADIPFVYTDYAHNSGRQGDPKTQQNGAIVQLVASSMNAIGEQQVKINSGFRGEDETNHDGNAFDIDVSHMDEARRIDLISTLSKNGARGIGVGPTTVHVDLRGDAPRIWWYDQTGDTATMPENLSWSRDVLMAHTSGRNYTGSPTDPTNVSVASTDSTKDPVDMTFEERVQAEMDTRILDRTLGILGISAEEYSAGARAYVPNVPEIRYTFTPKRTTDDIPSSFNAMAIAALMESDRYKATEGDPAARMELIRETKASLEAQGGGRSSPKDDAYALFLASPEYMEAEQAGDVAKMSELIQGFERSWGATTSNAAGANRAPKTLAFEQWREENPDATSEDIMTWERTWNETTARDSTTGDPTLTAGKLAQRRADAEEALLSDDPEVVAAAQRYLNVVYPIQERALLALEAAQKEAGEGPTVFSVKHITADGRTVRVDAIEVEGGYIALTDKDRENPPLLESVSEVMLPETLKERNALITRASEVIKVPNTTRSNVAVAAQGAFALDRMAARNEAILTTVAGGVSMFEGGKREVLTLMKTISDMGLDPSQNEQSIMAAINARIDEQIGSGSTYSTQQVAQQYKEFSAAVVRYVFAAGKALGQEGNGFSNADYENILSSIVNANSYAAFSRNLRNFTVEQMNRLDADVDNARNNGQVLAAMEFQGTDSLLGQGLRTAQESFANSDLHGKWYAWARREGETGILATFPSVGDAEVAIDPAMEQFRGKRVIIYADGSIEEF